MNEILLIAYAVWAGFLNMAAGRDFFGKVQSTVLSRAIFAVGTAAPLLIGHHPAIVAAIAVALFLWRMPAWDFAAITGEGKPDLWQNKLARKLWKIEPQTLWEKKLMGTLGMAIRMSLIIPAVLLAGNYLSWVAFPLMGIAYFASGLLGEQNAVARAEFLCALLIAVMLWG